jgi:ATP-dependent Clp protease ATP-binding subunit ClpA
MVYFHHYLLIKKQKESYLKRLDEDAELNKCFNAIEIVLTNLNLKEVGSKRFLTPEELITRYEERYKKMYASVGDEERVGAVVDIEPGDPRFMEYPPTLSEIILKQCLRFLRLLLATRFSLTDFGFPDGPDERYLPPGHRELHSGNGRSANAYLPSARTPQDFGVPDFGGLGDPGYVGTPTLEFRQEELSGWVDDRFNFISPTEPNFMAIKWCLRYGTNMTVEVLKGNGNPAFGRDSEMFRVITLLGRRVKGNAMLLGEAGVGKTAVVEGLACAVVERVVPSSFQRLVFVEIESGAVMSGTHFRGDLELKMVGIIGEGERYPDLIYFIDEIHAICGAGTTSAKGGASLDITNMLKPALARGDFSLIGATTTAEFQSSVQRDEALERRFTNVKIQEPDPVRALEMLLGARFLYEKAHPGVCIPVSTLYSAVYFAGKYITGARYFPDKAVDLVDDSATAVESKFDQRGTFNYLAHNIKSSFWLKLDGLKSGDLGEALFQLRQHGYFRTALDAVKAARRKRRLFGGSSYDVPLGGGIDESLVFASWEFRRFEGDLVEKSMFWRLFDFITEKDVAYRNPQSFINPNTSTPALPETSLLNAHFFVPMAAVAKEVYDRTKIPVDEVPATNPTNERFSVEIREFEDKVRAEIVAQDEAIREICLTVMRSRTGIRDYTRPIAVLFFAGPTGVGKTELAKVVARYFFLSSELVYRFDMSEYSDRMAVTKLVGGPPGYQAMFAGGVLTNFVKRRQFSLLIFDEFEKAHYTVYDMLLGVFEDAILKDGCGAPVLFTNTMIVATSNAGAGLVREVYDAIDEAEFYYEEVYVRSEEYAEELRSKLAENREEGIINEDDNPLNILFRASAHLRLTPYLCEMIEAQGVLIDLELRKKLLRVGESSLLELVEIAVESTLAGSFRPEFINRLDRLIFFESFQRGDMILVAFVMYMLFRKSLISRYTALVNANYRLIKALAFLDIDLGMGARPVRRAFTKLVEDPLTNMMLRSGSLPLTPLNAYCLYFDYGAGLEFRALGNRDGFQELFQTLSTRVQGLVKRLKEEGGRVSLSEAKLEIDRKVASKFAFPDYNTSFSSPFGDVRESLIRPGYLQRDRVGLYVSETLTPEFLREFLQVLVGSQLQAARLWSPSREYT